MSIPAFNELGYLPPGIYETSWLEFMSRFATNRQRQRLVTGLAAALRKLGFAVNTELRKLSYENSSRI
jgi:hypothetical protein